MKDILDANPGPFLIVDAVREKEPVSLDPLLADGTLAVVAPETEAEFQTLIDLSLALDDGEAMTCAIALHRGYRVVTDEKKTVRLMGNQIPIIGTLDLIRTWADEVTAPASLLREVLAAIADRGYIPGPDHPHRAWWDQMLGG